MVNITDEETILQSQIQQFFAESCVFVTGATGFLGKLILEKLLRTCNDIKKVYVLIREKKGKEVEKRFEEVLDNVFFERIKNEQPRFREKIELLTGDCALPDLGLSQDAKQKLINEVNVVFHCAATVRFDEKIRTAVNINIRATRDLLNLARQAKNLKSFVYISTAFSYCNRNDINEEFYEPTITGDQILTVVNNIDEDILQNITPMLLGSWPNTYALTKAVAEEVIKSHGQDLPVAVVRPSIVIATVSEPVPGWIDNMYGATGVTVGAALGVIRTLHCKADCRADVVPADFVINCAISAAWEVGTASQYKKLRKLDLNEDMPKCDKSSKQLSNGINKVSQKINETETNQCKSDIPIYNYVSSPQNPITWRLFMEYADRHLRDFPTPLLVWNYCFILNPYYFVHVICLFFLHTVPAYIADFVARCIGKEPIFVKGYRKINKFMDVLSYFSTKEWNFQNRNTQTLWGKLNTEDRKLFNFDIGNLDWDPYFHSYAKGGRIYLLKDPLDTLPQGRIKYMKLKVAHYALVTVLLFILYKLLTMLWGLFVWFFVI